MLVLGFCVWCLPNPDVNWYYQNHLKLVDRINSVLGPVKHILGSMSRWPRLWFHGNGVPYDDESSDSPEHNPDRIFEPTKMEIVMKSVALRPSWATLKNSARCLFMTVWKLTVRPSFRHLHVIKIMRMWSRN